MKKIQIIKQELLTFGKKYKACEKGLEAIKGDTLTELFGNMGKYIYWCKGSYKKEIKFNSIFDNELVIEDGVLLCNCSDEKTIKIPTTVHTIGERAFACCRGLASIEIPNSVTSIRNFAFNGCRGLKSIVN